MVVPRTGSGSNRLCFHTFFYATSVVNITDGRIIVDYVVECQWSGAKSSPRLIAKNVFA